MQNVHAAPFPLVVCLSIVPSFCQSLYLSFCLMFYLKQWLCQYSFNGLCQYSWKTLIINIEEREVKSLFLAFERTKNHNSLCASTLNALSSLHAFWYSSRNTQTLPKLSMTLALWSFLPFVITKTRHQNWCFHPK